ncbi:hypothetical protein E3N88_40356 [Mikania micrantha]|uniref:Uncharacterized protein n=1 Tax=Mikania micrantha TaxID=192012 RepID=A0A5N6LMH0_9ASTR|nr:hypothetical protein E3N88_40356 [Mikania micrantha]
MSLSSKSSHMATGPDPFPAESLLLRLNFQPETSKHPKPFPMEVATVSYVLGVAAIFLFYMLGKISNSLWFKPKKMEKLLKYQGLKD